MRTKTRGPRVRREPRAEDLMASPIITLNTQTRLRDAAQLLSDEQISGALVTDHRGVAVGVVSLFDIASCLAGFTRQAGAPGGFYRKNYPAFDSADGESWPQRPEGNENEEGDPLDETTVGEIMAPGVIGVDPESTLREVARTLCTKHIHRVFVSGKEGPRGVISTMDVLKAVAGVKSGKAKR